MVSAAIEAFNAVDDHFWCEQAHLAFDWFLGRNDLGQPLYDTSTGGCHDGLQENRVNENQGAESTLAFLLSLAEMELLENSFAAFQSSEPSSLKAHHEEDRDAERNSCNLNAQRSCCRPTTGELSSAPSIRPAMNGS